MNKFSPDNLKRLHEIHEQRYSHRLKQARMGKPGFREDELVYYLNLWREIKIKKFIFDDLTQDAKSEIHDALSDEE